MPWCRAEVMKPFLGTEFQMMHSLTTGLGAAKDDPAPVIRRARRRPPVPSASYPPGVRAWIKKRGGLTRKVIYLRGREPTAIYIFRNTQGEYERTGREGP